MIDTSILVEYFKTTKTTLLDSLLADSKINCFINETIVSEFLFQLLKLNTGKAPRTLHEAGKLPDVLKTGSGYMILNVFWFLPTTDELYALVPALMIKYNLLPNDAIILATCKIHGITQLASHDSDFITPCKEEGIALPSE